MSKINIKVIEGSGFIAKKFNEYGPILKKYNIIVYAAGISNSGEKNKVLLNKEISRLKKFCSTNKKKMVYISTYSIFDKTRNKSYYIKNKMIIEKIIKANVKSFLIIRFPEIVGKNNNSNALTNFFYKKIKTQKKFFVYSNAKRNLLDIDDAIKLSLYFIKKYSRTNKIINLLNLNFYKPIEIVNSFEKLLKKRTRYEFKNINKKKWRIKNSISLSLSKKLGINFHDNYLFKTLKRYYK